MGLSLFFLLKAAGFIAKVSTTPHNILNHLSRLLHFADAYLEYTLFKVLSRFPTDSYDKILYVACISLGKTLAYSEYNLIDQLQSKRVLAILSCSLETINTKYLTLKNCLEINIHFD